MAWHIGFSGSPLQRLHYRVLASWQRSYGSYYYLPANPMENVSCMAEAAYTFADGWSFRGAIAADFGKLRGDNFGLQLSVVKRGIIK